MVHNRSAKNLLASFDLEIEKTLSRNRKAARETVKMANNQTLKQLTEPNLVQQPLAVTFPAPNDGVKFELMSGLVH